MKTKLTSLSALFVVGFLSACGGGGGDGGSFQQDQQAGQASLRDCFLVTPGVQFTNSDNSKNINVQEQFEGQLRFGIRRINAANTRAVTQYFALTDTHYQFIGDLVDDTGTTYKYVFSSDYRLPLNMSAGSSTHINATETETDQFGAQATTSFGVTYTFHGFENLSLAGRSFANACKLEEVWDGETEKTIFWLAKGYGIVKTEMRDQNGAVIQSESNQIASVSVAP